MAGITNYYVPSSISKSYVENKRTEEGTRGYLQSEQEVDIQKQSALQNLEQQYSSTIENAYASYLQNQRNINMYTMGEGYKQLYREMQEKELASNIAQTNLSAAQARQELTTQTEEAKADIQAMKNLEISNLNRVQNTMQQYLNYVKSMQETEGLQLLTEEQQNMYIDDLYDILYTLPTADTPVSSYSEWVKSNLTGSKEDIAWGDWLYSGGLQDFMNAVKRTKALETKPQELKPYSNIGYTEETAPEGYESSSTDEVKSSNTILGNKVNVKKGDKITGKNIKGDSSEYTVVSNVSYVYGAISGNLKEKLSDPKSLATGTILEGKKTGEYFMYVGIQGNQPRFVWLRK